jgi:hypothetical protein
MDVEVLLRRLLITVLFTEMWGIVVLSWYYSLLKFKPWLEFRYPTNGFMAAVYLFFALKL